MGEPPNSASPLLPDTMTMKGAGKGDMMRTGVKGDLFGYPDTEGKGGFQNACTDGVNRCDVALGGPGAPSNWNYVGGGKGGYEMVETLVYVGEGKGNYSKDDPPPVKQAGKVTISWQRRLYMGTLVFFLLAGGISLLASLILGPKQPKASSSTAATHSVDHRSAHHSFLGSRSSADQEPTCSVEGMDRWSFDKRQWCCTQKGIGCPPMTCRSRDNWEHAWSPGKKIWCCRHEGVGCPGGSPVSQRAAPARVPQQVVKVEPTTPPPQVVSFGSPATSAKSDDKDEDHDSSSDSFDCKKDEKWKTRWSGKQKDWCCWHYGEGCPDS
eukprot:TRINITY_DN43997_c0_g1_i1.p1 TRINITY_DN43997_c0_g1~~TRINITY_DN43997_c0_g1_i1.p1  ORF type:complete len:324 (-),score=57.04 TRINITY_DN43997_c0_g1_i1:110-1081(-)